MFAEVLSGKGTLLNTAHLKLVRKLGQAGEQIPRHNHPGEEILFAVQKGRIRVCLNGEQYFELGAGEILHFDGEQSISAEFLEEAEALVTLVPKSV